MPLPGPSRYDAWTWAAGLGTLIAATALASAAGVRLGAALTLGVVLLMAVVLGALGAQEVRRRGPRRPVSPPPRRPRGRAAPRRGR